MRIIERVALLLALSAALVFSPAPHAVAQDDCGGSATTDNYSLQCVPNMVPDFSDQLTESEVAEPGFNASPGGGGGHR